MSETSNDNKATSSKDGTDRDKDEFKSQGEIIKVENNNKI